MYYAVNASKITFEEYWRVGSFKALLFYPWVKLFRPALDLTGEDPTVDTLQPFEVLEAELDPVARDLFHRGTTDFLSCQCYRPIYHQIDDPRTLVKLCRATCAQDQGLAFARLHCCISSKPHPPKIHCYPEIVTAFADGTFLLSTAGKPDLALPDCIQINRRIGATLQDLWQSHKELLRGMATPIIPVRNDEELREAVERQHAVICNFHVQRGVFQPLTEKQLRKTENARAAQQMAADVGSRHPEVMMEIQRLQEKKSGWGKALLLFVISLILFAWFGNGVSSWKTGAYIILILFVHECGHFLAMRWFKYTNLRMFFIPFFGAAVSGRNYNVPGWKKVIVSLMGPLPGVIIGSGLIVLGQVRSLDEVRNFGFLMAALNLFNLLPVLPLDGGWIMHTLLFSRHYVLDIAFRVLAALGLMGISLVGHMTFLRYVAIATLIGLPTAGRLALITNRLRQRELPQPLPDDQTLPQETAEAIIDEVKEAFPKGANNQIIAQHSLHIFETLNARSPGWLASLGLLIVYGGSLLAPMLAIFAMFISHMGGLHNLASVADTAQCTLSPGSIQIWPVTKEPEEVKSMVVAKFKKLPQAQAAFASFTNQLPAHARVLLFGQHLLVGFPASDETVNKEWAQKLQLKADDVFVENTNYQCVLTLACLAPDKETAQRLREESAYYLTWSRHALLIPPWTIHDKTQIMVRRSMDRLEKCGQGAWNDPEVKIFEKQIQQSRKMGDSSKVKELCEVQNATIKRLIKEKQTALAQECSGQVTADIIQLYQSLPTESYGSNYWNAIRTNVAPRLGQLPLINGKPAPGTDRYSTVWGSVQNHGLLMRFPSIYFKSLIDGAPAMIEWLNREKCVEFNYDFHQTRGGNDLEDED